MGGSTAAIMNYGDTNLTLAYCSIPYCLNGKWEHGFRCVSNVMWKGLLWARRRTNLGFRLGRFSSKLKFPSQGI